MIRNESEAKLERNEEEGMGGVGKVSNEMQKKTYSYMMMIRNTFRNCVSH